MDHGYGGHPYGTGPQQQFPPPPPMHGAPPQQQFPGAGGPSFFGPPPPPMAAGFPPYGPAMPYPTAPFVPQPVPPQQQQQPQQQQGPIPHGFFNPWDPPPPMAPPPSDSELQKRIDKLVEYAAKNGPEFEKMLKEKQKENPLYAFLFGAEGYGYYRYKLWITVNPHLASPYIGPPMPGPNPGFSPAMNPTLAGLGPVNPGMNPPLQGLVHPPYYDQQPVVVQQQQQHHQPPYFEPAYQESRFGGLSGPLPAEVAGELHSVIDSLTGTKDSIKGAKNWFMQRLPFAPALAEAMRDRVLAMDDDIRQLHVIFLVNDILFDSLQRRINLKELDNEALAFQPVLGSMLSAVYYNPRNKDSNQTRLQKILQFWGSKEVFSIDTIASLEKEMISEPPAGYRAPGHHPVPQMESALSLPESVPTKDHMQMPSPERSSHSFQSPSGKEENPLITAFNAAQFGANSGIAPSAGLQTPSSIPSSFTALNPPFLNSLTASTPVPSQSASGQLAAAPPYPLFPPGLIPGMVRKKQIGTGVPYSALSPLDIPAVIPPSATSDSYILDRVAKFFKEIGEVDPLEGQVKSSRATYDDDDEREERDRGRSGGACIPPPSSLSIDPDTNTLPDGSIEHKPGSINTGRLGLGAVADPNEITQYDDVYTSYRKQRSTSYHSFMSARAAAR